MLPVFFHVSNKMTLTLPALVVDIRCPPYLTEVQTAEVPTSRLLKNRSLDCGKSDPNNTDIIRLNIIILKSIYPIYSSR